MNNFKLITENKEYWFLIDTKSDKTLEYPYEWDGYEVVAYKKIINDSLELPLPKLPELPNKSDSKKWSDKDIANAFMAGYNYSVDCYKLLIKQEPVECSPNLEKYLQSISYEFPAGFEPEHENVYDVDKKGGTTTDEKKAPHGATFIKKLKVVNGVLQGTYKF